MTANHVPPCADLVILTNRVDGIEEDMTNCRNDERDWKKAVEAQLNRIFWVIIGGLGAVVLALIGAIAAGVLK